MSTPHGVPATTPRGSRGHRALHGVRRATVPLVLGVVCLLVAVPAVEDLDRLLRGVGVLLLVLAAVIVAATALTRPDDEA